MSDIGFARLGYLLPYLSSLLVRLLILRSHLLCLYLEVLPAVLHVRQVSARAIARSNLVHFVSSTTVAVEALC